MLKSRTNVLVLCFIALAVATFLWMSFGSPTEGQVCEYAKEGGQPHCASHYLLTAIFLNAVLWVEKFHDTLLVIGTFLLAVGVFFQIKDSRKSSERQLRAYVSVFEVHFTRFGQLGGDFVANYKNTGQSPAYDVEAEIGVTFATFPLVETLGRAPEGTLSKTVLGPNVEGHTELTPPRAMTPEELGRIAAGSAAVFVHGQITYKDIFGRRWETRYRYYVGGDVGVELGQNGHVAAHAEGNTAT